MNTATIDPYIADIEMTFEGEGFTGEHDLKIEYLYNREFREFWNNCLDNSNKALIVFLFEQCNAYQDQIFAPYRSYGPVLAKFLSLKLSDAADRMEYMINAELPYHIDWISRYVDYESAVKDSAIQEVYFGCRDYYIFDSDFFDPRRSRW